MKEMDTVLSTPSFDHSPETLDKYHDYLGITPPKPIHRSPKMNEFTANIEEWISTNSWADEPLFPYEEVIFDDLDS